MISLDIKDEYELLALHNSLMEAKFSVNPNKKEIISSPFVANLSNKVCDLLELEYKPTRMDKLRKRPSNYNGWTEWRRDLPKEKLEAHLLRHKPDDWENLELPKKLELLKIMLAPYYLTEEEYREICLVVDGET